jgi:galactokinase
VREPTSPDALVASLLERYPEAADHLEAVRVVRSPGRVNLIGEHTDYNLGYVLPAAIDLEIRLAFVPTADGRVELTRLGEREDRASFDLDVQPPARGSWIDYAEGTAWALAQAGHPTTGFRGVIESTVPAGGGLASSAAVELATAWALLGDRAADIDPMDLAVICQQVENGFVGVRSGVMDQFAAACGTAGSALLLDCRSLEWRPVALPADAAVVVIDSQVPRTLAGSKYNERRDECDAAVAALRSVDPSIESLRDVSQAFLDAHVDLLDEVVARRARHVVDEDQRVLDVIDAFARGDLKAVGDAFAASHASLRDLYEVSCPELDALVEIATSVDGVIAARMTGAGFGGCTVNLVRPDAVEALRTAVEREYPARSGRRATVMPVEIADGAGWLDP